MTVNGRSIYGCGSAPEELKAPADCRYTYNPETYRLYVHLLAWPFGRVVLENLGGKVAYAQFLHDGSEILMTESKLTPNGDNMLGSIPAGSIELALPTVKPKVAIPVIELFLVNPSGKID